MSNSRSIAEVADTLARDGIAVSADFLKPDLVQALANEAREAFAAGEFHPAGVGGGHAHALRTDIRGDHIRWLDRPASDAQRDQ